MRAMQKGLHRVLVISEHDTSHHPSCVLAEPPHAPPPPRPLKVAQCLDGWLQKHAFWEGGRCVSWRLPDNYVVQGITGDWCDGYGCLAVLKNCCTAANGVCGPWVTGCSRMGRRMAG